MDLKLFSLSFEKYCIRYVSFYDRVDLDSIIFHTKQFDQKHVLTGCFLIHFTMET